MFVDSLRATLELTIDGTTSKVPAGAIKRLEVELESWGFTGVAEWWVVTETAGAADAFFALFVGSAAGQVKLVVQRAFDDPGAGAETMVLQGVVTGRDVVERIVPQVAEAPVLQRRYAIRFEDRAGALWKEHYPAGLYADETLANVLADHVPGGVTLTSSWVAGDVTHSVISLALGPDPDGPSFRDFVFWLLDRYASALYYDSAADTYAARDTKPSTSAPKALDREKVSGVETVFPATERCTVSVQNAFADAAARVTPIVNAEAVTGVRKDVLVRTPVGSDVDERVAIETARAQHGRPSTRVALSEFPVSPLLPPDTVQLGEAFGKSVLASGATMRVVRVTFSARAVSQAAGDRTDDPTNRYECGYDVVLEDAADPAHRYPAYRAPRWPLAAEGKVVSEIGAETDETYEPYTDKTTSLDRYKVTVPLWGNVVVASFEPNLLTGHFYFPVTKGARVLLSLGFLHADITAFLDWRGGARLPLDSQGNHIVMGKAATSQTSIRHVYVDAQPAFEIVRTSGTDQQTLTVAEGLIRWETKDTGAGGS